MLVVLGGYEREVEGHRRSIHSFMHGHWLYGDD